MSELPVAAALHRRKVRLASRLAPAALLAAGLLVLSWPIDADGPRGSAGAGPRGGSGGEGRSFSGGGGGLPGGGRGLSGGGRSYSGGAPRGYSTGRSYSSAAPRGSAGGRSYSGGAPRGYSTGRSYSSGAPRGYSTGRSYSGAAPRGSSGGRSYSAGAPRGDSGGRSYSAAPPRASSGGGSGRSSSLSSSPETRRTYGDRPLGASSAPTGSGPRTYSATGPRGGSGGPPPGGGGSGGGHPGGGPGNPPGGGGHPGGGHPGGGHYGGSHHGGGWYCPPTHWAGTSWYWGGPWNWWWGWGWGPYWGSYWGSPWGWGGVYVVNDVDPVPNVYARVDTDVSPESAEVYLDGTLIGQADDFDGFPDYLYLEAGTYRLEFRHPGYETISRDVEARAGTALAINDEMKLLPGTKKLSVVDPADVGTPLGRVFAKGGWQAETPSSDRTGRFDVVPGPDSSDEDLDAPRPEEVPPAARGRLRFDVAPGDAAVYLDDRYVGTGEELGELSRGLPVNPGLHVVMAVRPGYEARRVEVEARAGAAVDVVIALEE